MGKEDLTWMYVDPLKEENRKNKHWITRRNRKGTCGSRGDKEEGKGVGGGGTRRKRSRRAF